MTAIVPLIRAAAAMPILNWLDRHDRPVASRLREAGLGYLPLDDPNRPVPLLDLLAFLCRQAELEGPDVACRVVTSTSVAELANLGLVAMSGRTPRESLARIAAALPRHCTHEVITLEERRTSLVVREYWHWKFDAATLHLIQQYVASLIECMCRVPGQDGPVAQTIRMVPHPETGLAHLAQRFGGRVEPADTACLEIVLANAVADARFAGNGPRRLTPAPAPEDWTRLRAEGTLAESVRIAIAAMLNGDVPGVERLAFAAGMSVRSFQRRLADEGTSFSQLLEEVRHGVSRRRLGTPDVLVADVAAELGYAHPSGLSRAMRRWTGQPPRKLRS